MTLLATTCLLPCLVSQILFQMFLTASKQLTHVLSAVTIYAIFLIEFGKHFSNCLAVFTRYRFNLSQYLFFADPYLIKSLSLVVTVKILLSAVAMAPSCHRYRTMASSLCRIIAFIALYCFALASSSPRYLIIAPSLQHHRCKHRCKHEPHDSIRIPYILKSNKLCPTIICITMCLHSSSAYQSY